MLMPGTFTPFFTAMFVYGRGISCSKLLFTDHYTAAGGAALRSCSVQITYVDILGLPAKLTYQRMFLCSLQGREENLMQPHIRNRELISPCRFQRLFMVDSMSNVFAASILLGTLHMDCCPSWSSPNLVPEPSVSALHGLTCYRQCKTFTKQFIRAIHKAWNSFLHLNSRLSEFGAKLWCLSLWFGGFHCL